MLLYVRKTNRKKMQELENLRATTETLQININSILSFRFNLPAAGNMLNEGIV